MVTQLFTLNTPLIRYAFNIKQVDIGQFLMSPFFLGYIAGGPGARSGSGTRLGGAAPATGRLGSALKRGTHKRGFLHHPVAPR